MYTYSTWNIVSRSVARYTLVQFIPCAQSTALLWTMLYTLQMHTDDKSVHMLTTQIVAVSGISPSSNALANNGSCIMTSQIAIPMVCILMIILPS